MGSLATQQSSVYCLWPFGTAVTGNEHRSGHRLDVHSTGCYAQSTLTSYFTSQTTPKMYLTTCLNFFPRARPQLDLVTSHLLCQLLKNFISDLSQIRRIVSPFKRLKILKIANLSSGQIHYTQSITYKGTDHL